MALFIVPGTLPLPIQIAVLTTPANAGLSLPVTITVLPAIPVFGTQNISQDWTLQINPIRIPLTQATIAAARIMTQGKIATFFDQTRVGKTLLNFGEDFQALILNWKYDTADTTNLGLAVKLYRPLPSSITPSTPLWIVRELSPSYLDQVSVVFIPHQGLKLYLRPPNRDVVATGKRGTEIDNVTLQSLLSTGSYDNVTYRDPVVEQWFTTAAEGVELNLDYTDYSQFVRYSSAVKRLNSFTQKLLIIENYNSIIAQQSSSMATYNTSVMAFTSSLPYAGYQRIAEQRLEVLRSFDGYERFLYYGSGSAYSSSFTGDSDDQLYYLNDATYPKLNGTVLSVASASNAALYPLQASQFDGLGDLSAPISWMDAIGFIADAYDIQNTDRLANNIPEYLSEDEDSKDFLTFVDMIGHHFDILRHYIDHMPDIYDRDSDPTKGLSPELVWNIASSLGINLPNQYAIKSLVEYTIGNLSETNPKIYREAAAETWKRFLHNQIYLLKTKGTANALRGLLNTYGVLPTTIQIRETATPSFYLTQSYQRIEEQTNALNLTHGTYITLPYSSSVQTVTVRFATTTPTQSVLFNVSNAWAVRLNPVSQSYGYLSFMSGSTTAMSSSVFQIYSGNYYTVALRSGSLGLEMFTQRADDQGDIVDYSYVTSSAPSVWSTGTSMYLGSSGSHLGDSFVGLVDEVRLWSEYESTTGLQFQAQYPALYNGNTPSSAYNNLLIRLSFNKPLNLFSSALPNESPYIWQAGRAGVYTQFSASNFQNNTGYPYSMDVVTRNVLRYTSNAGASQYVSNKITIADPPQFRMLNSSGSLPTLSYNTSMVTLDQKKHKVQSNNVVGFYFSITDAINDSIIRSIGNIDLQNYIGDPRDVYNSSYSALDALNALYWTNYAYTYNFNQFIRFVETLLLPLFQQATEMVPARAKLLTGIVIEPSILDRRKIANNHMISDDENDYEVILEDSICETASGAYNTLEMVLSENLDVTPSGEYNTYFGKLDTTILTTPEAEYDTYECPLLTTNISLATSKAFNTTIDEDSNRANYSQMLLNRFGVTDMSQLGQYAGIYAQLIQAYSPAPQVFTGMNNLLPSSSVDYAIGPVADFGYVGATTYFSNPLGLVRTIVPIQVLKDANILSNQGTWVAGQVYHNDQYVLQQNQSGSAASGNGKTFVCSISVGTLPFVSYIAPSLDTNNWVPAQYLTIPSVKLSVASVQNGDVLLTNPASGLTPFIGYDSRHLKYHRDTLTATKRRNWYGCLVTDDNSPNGLPAVQSFPTAGDRLIVSTGAAPVMGTGDVTGPILDVTGQ